MDQDTLAAVNKCIESVQGYIAQFKDGLITSHEMANASINTLFPIVNTPEIDSAGDVDCLSPPYGTDPL